MSIINLFGDVVLRDDVDAIFYVMTPNTLFREEYLILKTFNPLEVETSLTHRGRKPSAEAMVELLIMQGYIKPRSVQ